MLFPTTNAVIVERLFVFSTPTYYANHGDHKIWLQAQCGMGGDPLSQRISLEYQSFVFFD
ncbi:hypothetical protein OVY01_08190 [Robbsia sp. Bb-Pol-6]|uniref:Uncharacterized protein n=1 Tax=Robbsia betulipollinis TaxID=2981849 RepID=A0ABT3ZL12_9BURK|nr:hypothetical protein [Robbsia betulipollinis]MCY0387211.1 hypothetical protein [Robbsia betulipollinis]